MKRALLIFAAVLFAGLSLAQTGTFTNHAILLGRGPGVTGLGQLAPPVATNQVLIGNPGVDPAWGNAGTGTVNAGAGGIVPQSGSPTTLYIEQMPLGGRLTPINGTCQPKTDQVGVTTLYYAPCGTGMYLPLYDGTIMRLWQFTANNTDTTGLSYVMGTNTASATLNDVWLINNSGTLALCVSAWSSSGAGTSTRGYSTAQFKGVQTNAASLGCRLNNTTTTTCAQNQCTLLGFFYTSGVGTVDLKFGTNAVGGGAACICIGNVYNMKQAQFSVGETTTTWNYTSTTPRPTFNSTGNRVDYVNGLDAPPVDINADSMASNSNSNIAMSAGVGVNSQSTDSASTKIPAFTVTANNNTFAKGALRGPNAFVPVGFNSIYRLEYSVATGTTAWIGAVGVNGIQTTLSGTLWY